MDLDQKIAYFKKNGWCPLPYKHLPEKLKRIMRNVSWRLQMKQCYKNCQNIMISADAMGIEGIEYVEGWVQSVPGLWLHHSWLVVDGKLADPTLEGRREDVYEERVRIPFEQIRLVLVERGHYSPIEEEGNPPSRCVI